jgi:hypothetical protein
MSLKRYAIWDKETEVITPIGEILTPSEWMERYPVAKKLTTVCSAGDINGGFFGVLSQMKLMYENEGADFSEATTDEEVLEVIEAFEDARNEEAANIEPETTDETRIADALEDLVVLNQLSQQS